MEADKEIKAIADILGSLEGLDDQARERVFKYVIERLGLRVNLQAPAFSPDTFSKTPYSDDIGASHVVTTPVSSGADIRSLKEQKQPESAIQMAVLVAYYLQEIVSADERKESIGVDEIQKYFKQAGFALPKIPISALKNAKAAGYLESADRGTYKLNPVGYNLIAHGLPSKGGNGTRTAKKPSKTKKVGKPRKK